VIYLLDTTVLIDYATGRPSATALLDRLFADGGGLWTCDVIVCEALSGGTPHQRREIGILIGALEYVSTHADAARWAGGSRRARGATSHRTSPTR
jgi:predicted nucleic acid-binding protein